MGAKPLTESPRFDAFIRGRDQVLQDILFKYTRAINITLEFLKQHCVATASHIALHGLHRENLRKNREEFEKRIKPWFDAATTQATMLVDQLRRTTYVLSYAGQAEAIARALGKRTKVDLSKHDIFLIANQEMPSGGKPHLRIELAYTRLKQDVLDAFHLSQVLESPVDETIDRIERAFPKSKKVKSFKKIMAPMRESARDDEDDIELSVGTIEPEDWATALEDYKSDVLPAEDYHRSPYDKIFYSAVDDEGEITTYTRYEWEVENEMTQDFVSRVRDGEIDAANDNGIDEFQWIAIIDDKTDECCEWRDGLTTREIEDELDGDHSDDECDATTPPAHFNCRCRLAPMTKDWPEETPPDFGSFDDWLDEKAAA